jgi:hypothetical protein
LRDSKYLFVNKMIPKVDFGSVLCWHEEMRRRTILNRGKHRLNPNYYQNWPQTRYYKEWLNTYGNVNLTNFKCNSFSFYSVKFTNYLIFIFLNLLLFFYF